MGIEALPSPSEGVFILLLVNTATSLAVVKDLFRIILHAVGINILSGEDCDPFNDPCSAAWSSPAVSSNHCQDRKSYTQQLIEDFRRWSPPFPFNADCLEVQQHECLVCLNHFESETEVNKLRCGHLFHSACLEKWLNYRNTTCPLCRTPMMPLYEEPDCYY